MSEQQSKANHYAQAILEAVLDQWQSALIQVSDALAQNSRLRSTLESATKDTDEKMKSLQAVLPGETSAEIQNFLSLLVQEGDLDKIPAIVRELRSGIAGQSEPQKAEIVSAMDLSEQEQTDLRRRLIEEHGEGLIFSFQVDPSLLGGLRVRVGDTLIDNSVVSRLATMREIVSASVR